MSDEQDTHAYPDTSIDSLTALHGDEQHTVDAEEKSHGDQQHMDSNGHSHTYVQMDNGTQAQTDEAAQRILQASLAAASAHQTDDSNGVHAAVDSHDAQADSTEQHGQEYAAGHEGEDHGDTSAYFEQEYPSYDFPSTSAAGLGASGPAHSFAAFSHSQHPHLGVEALGHASASSHHGATSVPAVDVPEGDEGHEYNGVNGGDQSMGSMGDTSLMSADVVGNQTGDVQHHPSSGPTRSSLGLPDASKKETPYSRSPDMRNSHKLAERRRRKEMRDLFDELRDQIPADRGPKTSKWEVLSKAIEYLDQLHKERDQLVQEVVELRRITSGEQHVDAQEVHEQADAIRMADADYGAQQEVEGHYVEGEQSTDAHNHPHHDLHPDEYKTEYAHQSATEVDHEHPQQEDWAAHIAAAQ